MRGTNSRHVRVLLTCALVFGCTHCGSTTWDAWIAPEATFRKAVEAKDREDELDYIETLAAVGERAAAVCRSRLDSPSASRKDVRVALLVLMWIKSPVDRQRFVDRLGTADAEFRGISATALRAYDIDDIAPTIGRMVLTEQDPATRVALVNLLGHSRWEGRQHVLDQLLRESEPEALDSLTLHGRLRDAIEQAR